MHHHYLCTAGIYYFYLHCINIARSGESDEWIDWLGNQELSFLKVILVVVVLHLYVQETV